MISETEGYNKLFNALTLSSGSIACIPKTDLKKAMKVLFELDYELRKVQALAELCGNGSINPVPLLKDVNKALKKAKKWK